MYYLIDSSKYFWKTLFILVYIFFVIFNTTRKQRDIVFTSSILKESFLKLCIGSVFQVWMFLDLQKIWTQVILRHDLRWTSLLTTRYLIFKRLWSCFHTSIYFLCLVLPMHFAISTPGLLSTSGSGLLLGILFRCSGYVAIVRQLWSVCGDVIWFSSSLATTGCCYASHCTCAQLKSFIITLIDFLLVSSISKLSSEYVLMDICLWLTVSMRITLSLITWMSAACSIFQFLFVVFLNAE